MMNRTVTFRAPNGKKTLTGRVVREDEHEVRVQIDSTDPFTGEPWKLVARVQRDDPSLKTVAARSVA